MPVPHFAVVAFSTGAFLTGVLVTLIFERNIGSHYVATGAVAQAATTPKQDPFRLEWPLGRLVTTVAIKQEEPSAQQPPAAEEPRGPTEAELPEIDDGVPEDPLVKKMKACEAGGEADYDCIARFIRERDEKLKGIIRQDVMLEAGETAAIMLLNVVGSKKAPVFGADSVEAAALRLKGVMRLNQLREIIGAMRRETHGALLDKED